MDVIECNGKNGQTAPWKGWILGVRIERQNRPDLPRRISERRLAAGKSRGSTEQNTDDIIVASLLYAYFRIALYDEIDTLALKKVTV